ncbi:MAG: AAA family ATPase [Reyranellaceae bacterium]
MIFELGPFRLDTEDNLLFRGSEPLALGRRAIALLRALVERPGALVTKDALIDVAWPGQAVEESNLTVQIAALRKALGEVAGGERWIETMPRRGYRFTGPVLKRAATGRIAPQVGAARQPTPTPSAGAERRQIAALSCELVGASRRADGEDLEDLRQAIADFQGCVGETVARYGGFVADHLSNTALVLFGYPASHEHDAEQAVRAGLALCAAVGAGGNGARTAPRCRVGIATGMAIVADLTPSGAEARRDIVGDAPNLAIQLRLTARPGVVTIDSDTRRLIGGLFDCRDLGTIDTDGSEPVRVWRVLGESMQVSRFEALRGPTLMRLVGREHEISLLLQLWSRAVEGAGQVALVAGEAGLGKSRLVVALEERLDNETHFRLRYFCSPHHQDSPLFPFVDQLGRAAGFGRDDTPTARLEKLRALLARADLQDEDVVFLVDLLGLPLPEGQSLPTLTPARRKDRVLEALCRQLEGLSRQRPVMVILEDAHWIDATSRALLDIIVGRARTLNVLVIVTFRPEFEPPWTDQPLVTNLALNRLDRRDRIALAVEVAGKPLPAAVIEQIADRTDGVPLFVEELTKSVLESGFLRMEADRYVIDRPLPALAIPSSLYASLLARFDRPNSASLVAQISAAIGREFSYELLRAVWELSEEELKRGLVGLVASELVFQRGAPPIAAYSFKHALVRDAAYGSLLRDGRRRWHARIAQALEARSPGVMETQPQMLAWHHAEAGSAEKAVALWAKAGRRSAARSALAEAAAQFQKALDQLALLPETDAGLRQELEIRSALGAVLRFLKGQASLETRQAYAHMRELWSRLGSPSELRHMAYGLSMAHAYGGDLVEARNVGEELLRVSRERDDSSGIVLGHSVCGQIHFLAGELQAARFHLERLLAIYDPAVHDKLVQQAGSSPLMTQSFLAYTLCSLGWPDQGLARSASAIADARRLAHPTSLAVGLALGALQASLVGDHATMEQRANELTTVAAEQGLPYYSAWGAILRGRAQALNGDVQGGIALMREGLEAYRNTGAVIGLPQFIDLLASTCEAAGQIEEAVSMLDEVIALTSQTGERWYVAEVTRHKGQLVLRQSDAEGAAKLYREALDIARQTEARFWELRAAVSLARLCREQGRPTEARDLLAPIYEWFTEGFALSDLVEAKALLASVQAGSTSDLPATAAAQPPGRPSIAVLPFQNMSGDPQQDYFVDGMVEDITTELSRFRELFVIARTTAFAYKGRALGVRQIAHELGVRYLLEGSVRRRGNDVRVTAQLIDAVSGAHLWAERYDRASGDIFILQDEITASVAAVIEPTVTRAERQRALRKPPDRLDAWEAYQRGLWHFHKHGAEDNGIAQTFFRQAIELDPNFASAHSGYAMALYWDAWLYSTRPFDALEKFSQAEARLAVSLDDKDATAHAVLATMKCVAGDWEESVIEARAALALNVNSAFVVSTLGLVLGRAGYHAEGIRHLRQAMRVSPQDPLTWQWLNGIADFELFSGQFEAALESYRQVMQRRPKFFSPYLYSAAALAYLGRSREARQALGTARARFAEQIERRQQRPPWARPQDWAIKTDGLRLAAAGPE